MHRVFGYKKKPSEKERKAAEEAEAAKNVDLESTVQRHQDRAKEIETKYNECNKQLAEYKKQLANTKSPAGQKSIRNRMKQVLQRRKMLEGQLDTTYSSMNQIEQTTFAIENTKFMQENLQAQKAAMHQLKEQNKAMDIEEFEDAQDDMEEILGDVQDVSDLMTRSYGLPDQVDDSQLDAELDALGDEIDAEGGMEETLGGAEEYDTNGASGIADPKEMDGIPSAPTGAPQHGRRESATAVSNEA